MQGWDQTVIKKVFNKAFIKLMTKPSTAPTTHAPHPINSQDCLFFHMEYHPMDVPRMTIQKIYREECEKVLQKELDIKHLTVAYSRPNTIGNIVAKAKLYQVSGKEVSKYITGELEHQI